MLVSDPFEKHVTRTMDALQRSVERAGNKMDSILQLQVFLCLPRAEGISTPTGKARFYAHEAQLRRSEQVLRKLFSPGKRPSCACMAVEWTPGDCLIEIDGSAKVVNPPHNGCRQRVAGRTGRSPI